MRFALALPLGYWDLQFQSPIMRDLISIMLKNLISWYRQGGALVQRGDRHVDFETLLVHSRQEVALDLKQRYVHPIDISLDMI